MGTQDTRNGFIDFYLNRGHELVRSGSLIPPDPDDPVLFVTSGMHPLIPYLQGRLHPQGRRLVNSQRCLRTTDLDEVGDGTHLTVFEMLGSWSLGDYDHRQSLRWGWELLTEGLGVNPELVSVTVFGGDDRCGPDLLSERTWQELGLPSQRVTRTVEENWWPGPEGMCGPDSEMFVWTGDGPPTGTPVTDSRWVEVWNHVSMTYRDTGQGLVPLPVPCVDTGMGLERMLMVLQGVGSVYDTDLFDPWMSELSRLWGVSGDEQRRLCDHLRSVTVVVCDGVGPSNTGRGYVLRRLVRRVLTDLWRTEPGRTLDDLGDGVFEHTVEVGGLPGDVRRVREVLGDEERRFRRLLGRGRPLVQRMRSRGPLTDTDLEWLRDTHGLPRDLVMSLLSER